MPPAPPAANWGDKPEVEAAIRATIGRTIYRLGDAKLAYPHLKRSYDLRKELLPPGHQDTLQSAVYLGGTLYQLQRLDDATALYQQALAAARPVLGDDHLIVLDAEFGYAIVVWRQRKFDEALALFQHIYDARSLNPDIDDTQLDAAQLNIAMIHAGKGDYDRAEPVFRASHEQKIKVLGRDHPVTMRVANNLGVALLNLERYQEGAELMRGVLNDRRRVLGADHYETLSTCINLGSIVSNLGELEEAAAIYRDGYNISLARYGPDHGRTLTLAFGLGNTLTKLGQLDEAETLLQDTLKRRKSSVGLIHPRTLATIFGLFELRIKQNRPKEAESLLAPAIAALREANTLADYDLYIEGLIECQLQIGKRTEALDLGRIYIDAIKTAHGENSEKARTAMTKLTSWRQNDNSKLKHDTP